MVYQKENISYRYNFTRSEQENNSQLMAVASMAIHELEDEKKAVMSEYKAKIDAKQSELNLLARHVIDKHTTKTTYAAKRKNFETMEWEWFDDDNNVLKREPLVGKDRQRDIPLEESPKKTDDGFDEETGEVFNKPTAEADISAFEKTGDIFNTSPAGSGIVSPEVEDLMNDQYAEQVHEAVVMLPPAPSPALPVGVTEATSTEPTPTDEVSELPTLPDATSTDEEYEKSDNEGADFNADTFNPEPPASLDKYPAKKTKATKAAKPATAAKKSPGRPKKS